MITDYSKLSMTKLVNAYQNYLEDLMRFNLIINRGPIDVVHDKDYQSVFKMYELTMVELNSVLTEVIKRLNLKKEK